MKKTYSIKEIESALLEECVKLNKTDAIEIALHLMKYDFVRMHGPEHHFLTGAALATAYCNYVEADSNGILEKLRIRCSNIMPAVCAHYGVCGDVMAVGAVISLILNTTHLSKEEWHITQKMTAAVQAEVSELYGPRCCKSTTLIVLTTAIEQLNKFTKLNMPCSEVKKCLFYRMNSTCHGTKCKYF